MGRRIADKLFKLPVNITKSTLLLKLRIPWDLLEAANPGCPDQFRAGDTVSLGGQYLASSGQTIFSVAQELALQPTDIIKFNEDLNPIYKLPAGSILIVPLPRTEFTEIMLRGTERAKSCLERAHCNVPDHDTLGLTVLRLYRCHFGAPR